MQTLFKRLTTVGLMVILIISTSITVYADNPIDEYIDAQGEDLYAAYQVFLNARGAGLTTASKKAFIAWMQSDTANSERLLGEIKRSPLYYINIHFRFSTDALSFLNAKLNEWASKYNIATSEQYANDNNLNTEGKIYSGKVITDSDGNTCLLFVINKKADSSSITITPSDLGFIKAYGTSLKYNTSYFKNATSAETLTFNFPNETITRETNYADGNSFKIVSDKGYPYTTLYYCYNKEGGSPSNTFIGEGYTCLVYNENNDRYYLGNYFEVHSQSQNIPTLKVGRNLKTIVANVDISPENADIDIKAPTGVLPDLPTDAPMYISPKDKDGNYYKTVNNYIDDSTTYINAPDIQVTPPVNEPDNPDEPEQPVPSGGGQLVPDGDGGFNFNFDLPDFDGFNFSIEGLNEKFPFSIPWDLMAFFTVLNAEPVTPELKGSLPFGDIYTWNFDFNLHEFDGIAAILRNIEFIAFCIGLMLITRQLIKG